MSFAVEVKTELCRVPLSRKCCIQAEAYGVLLYCNTFNAGEVRIVTENEAFAQRLPALFKKAFGIETVSLLRDERFNFQTLIAFNIFTAFGSNVILYTNAMSSVDGAIYEAAKMDGATNLQTLLKVHHHRAPSP